MHSISGWVASSELSGFFEQSLRSDGDFQLLRFPCLHLHSKEWRQRAAEVLLFSAWLFRCLVCSRRLADVSVPLLNKVPLHEPRTEMNIGLRFIVFRLPALAYMLM